jgi:hypothetical protein
MNRQKTSRRLVRRFFLIHEISGIPVFSAFKSAYIYDKARELNNPKSYYIEEFLSGKLQIQINALEVVENYKSSTIPVTFRKQK